MSDTVNLSQRIEQAIATVHKSDPLLTYKKHFRGLEESYTYRQFLDDIATANTVDVTVADAEDEVVIDGGH